MSATDEVQSAADEVQIERDGAIGTITLNDPATLNSLSAQTLAAVCEAIQQLSDDPQIRVLVLTGNGRGFSSGARLSRRPDGELDVDSATLDGVSRVYRLLQQCDKPVLGVVNGIAAGAGMSMALACDYVLAGDAAAFSLAFGKIALMPDGGATALVAASIGRARALRLALTAEKLPASTAAEWGLIAEVCPQADLQTRAAELAAAFAANAPLAMAETKHAINAAVMPSVADVLTAEEQGQVRLLATADFREGVTAFTEKRTASFTGR